MPKMNRSKSNVKRVKVKDLPRNRNKLSKDELKKVRGGVDGADFLVWQRQATQKGRDGKIVVDPNDPSGNTY